ncbi:hypothetical protein [Acidovorax radicis]|uniref:hypothetical protein n=1 Tax=Acidovorax radicis TaxID=758826 RepID=UPI001CF948F6|nr:hypothetical protein [Acidovorax radicis]UCV01098.1 hypothetical protein KI609_10470 [Acidovorax radicis]
MDNIFAVCDVANDKANANYSQHGTMVNGVSAQPRPLLHVAHRSKDSPFFLW